MGLSQGDSSRRKSRLLANWLLPIVALSVSAVLAITGDSGRDWFAFDRAALAAGEIWRLVTGHFAHLGVSHLLLNGAGFLLIWYLINTAFSRMQWLFVTLVVIAGIDFGFWFFEPNLAWYVGLSGMLHGLLAAGIIASLESRRADIWILGIALIGKITYETLVGPLPGSEQASGGMVITAAHAYGVVAGVLAAVLVLIRVRRQASI